MICISVRSLLSPTTPSCRICAGSMYCPLIGSRLPIRARRLRMLPTHDFGMPCFICLSCGTSPLPCFLLYFPRKCWRSRKGHEHGLGMHGFPPLPAHIAARLALEQCTLAPLSSVEPRKQVYLLPWFQVSHFFPFSSAQLAAVCKPNPWLSGSCQVRVVSWLLVPQQFSWLQSFPCHTSFYSSPFRGFTTLPFAF